MTLISRRTALLMPLAAWPAAAWAVPLSSQDKALVERASAYLEGLSEARARFVQTDARGAASQGTVYLKRPGKARFAYDPPSGLLVVSDGGRVMVSDSRLKTFDAYPLFTTPLSLFLAKHIRLDKGVEITRVARLADGFSITARDTGKKAPGQLTLTFSDAPLALLGWTSTDAQGRATRFRLLNLQRTTGLDPKLFVLRDPNPPPPGRPRM